MPVSPVVSSSRGRAQAPRRVLNELRTSHSRPLRLHGPLLRQLDPRPLPKERWTLMPGTRTELCLVYAHHRAMVQRLIRAGLPGAEYLPLAAASDRRVPIS